MTALELEQRPDGVVLPVQAQPKARRNGLNGIHAGRLKIQITQAPEKGKANQAIAKLLATLFNVSKSQIQLLSGDTSPQKKFLIQGRTTEEIHHQLETEL